MAPPPGSRSLCALRPGYLLAGRYRLERTVDSALADPPPATLWLARDEVLQRPVAAKVLPTGDARGALAARDLVDAAGAAGTLAHPVLARVYDAALDAHAGVAYVVSEWVEGVDLATSLAQDGPWQHHPAVGLA